jgi:hypothetical protein
MGRVVQIAQVGGTASSLRMFCRLDKRHSSYILNWDMSFSCSFCGGERTRRIGLVVLARCGLPRQA